MNTAPSLDFEKYLSKVEEDLFFCKGYVMAEKRLTRWFVEPRDAATNESAMMDLARVCGATDENIHYGKLDNKGIPHDVVEVDHAFVARMERNKTKFNQQYRVFNEREGESAMRLWRFGDKKNLSNTKEMKRMRSKLAKRMGATETKSYQKGE